MKTYRVYGSFDIDIEAESEEEAMNIFEDTYTFGEFMCVDEVER